MPDSRLFFIAAMCVSLVGCSREAAPAPLRRAAPADPRPVAPDLREALTEEKIVDGARPALVTVESLDRRGILIRSGTGWLVASRTVVTPWPVVAQAASIRILRTGELHRGSLSAVLESDGLARIATDLDAKVELARDPYPTPGSHLCAIGMRDGEIAIEGASVIGTSDAPGERDDAMAISIQPRATLTGSGLFDGRGELVAITDEPDPKAEFVLATPVRYIKDLLALPEGTLPKVTQSPLRRLASADREWLRSLAATMARGDRPPARADVERARAVIERMEPMVGAELAWARLELGIGWLIYRRALWEDAVDARVFRRIARSERRMALESRLEKLGVLSRKDIGDGNAIIRAVAAREPFDVPGFRVTADERWLALQLAATDRTRARIETALWQNGAIR